MQPDSAIRQELAAMGMTRKNHEREARDLTRRVADLLTRAEGVVPAAETARLIGLHRSTVHRFYQR